MWTEVADTARRQAGVIAIRQAVDLGLTYRQLHRRVDRDGFRALSPRTFLLPGHDITPMALAWAGVLTMTCRSDVGLGGAAVTGRTALWVRGLQPRPPALVEVVAPHGRRAPRIRGVAVIRSRTLLPDVDLGEVKGLPTATVARAMLDLARRERANRLKAVLIDIRQQRVDLAPVFDRAVEALPAPRLGAYLQVLVEVAGSRADSIFAHVVQRWLAAVGIDTVAEHPIRTPTGLVHADLAVPARFVAIECDGFSAHSTREQLDTDARRANGLALAEDWMVLRLTWDRFHDDRDGFLVELRAALASRGP